MIHGGNCTVFVSNMDKAVDFYTNVLGLKLRRRFDNNWAEVEAGPDLMIGLHPATDKAPAPGTPGSIHIGLTVTEPLETVMGTLAERGVEFVSPVVSDEPGRFVFLQDPDGHVIYLWEHASAPV